MTVPTRDVQAGRVPAESIDFLKPHAIKAGHSASDASVARWAIVELAERIQSEQSKAASSDAATCTT